MLIHLPAFAGKTKAAKRPRSLPVILIQSRRVGTKNPFAGLQDGCRPARPVVGLPSPTRFLSFRGRIGMTGGIVPVPVRLQSFGSFLDFGLRRNGEGGRFPCSIADRRPRAFSALRCYPSPPASSHQTPGRLFFTNFKLITKTRLCSVNYLGGGDQPKV